MNNYYLLWDDVISDEVMSELTKSVLMQGFIYCEIDL